MHDARRFAPATARNREPILEVLRRFVKPCAHVLEIASGSGEHAVFLAPRLEAGTWQPTDPDPESRASIDAWRSHEGDPRVLPAIDLDVTAPKWPAGAIDVVVCINMIHISPWAAAEALLAGAGALLPEGGILYLYGPYRQAGVATAASNEAFDASLRTRNPAWGLRDLETVVAAAARHGLALSEVVAMPANNLSVVLRRGPRAGATFPT